MKRYRNLYEKIISIDNLMLADEKAQKGKKKTYGVKLHNKNREENIIRLHESLKNKTYNTSDYHIFKIYEPKERVIYRLPYYPDRIVHHAIMNILEPIWTKTFTYNTYSCIKRRGIEACAKQVDKIIKQYKDTPLYCLKIDICKYYPSINHDVMKRIIRLKIKDKDLLDLLDEIIDSAEGLPIGNYLSQYLANLYLCYFMHYINERMPNDIKSILNLDYTPKIYCTEYADDIVFYSDSKDILHQVFVLSKIYLERELKLNIKGNYQIFPIAYNRYDRHGRVLDYVGYKFYKNQKLIRKRIKQNFCRLVYKINKYLLTLSLAEYKQLIAPYLGWAKHSDSKHLLTKIINKKYYASILR